MDSSFFVEHDSSLSNIDSKLQPFLSEISSQLQGLFPGQNTPAQLTQTYDTTDLKSLQALIKAESSQQMSQPLLATDNAGNTLATARNIGNLTGTRNFSDFVGAIDTNDYYLFTLSGNNNFKLAMTGMTANADVQLLNSAGGVITSSRATGSNPESIIRNLSAGTYYVRTYPVGTANTNYNLSIQAIADNAGNTLATARNLGNLNGIRNFSDFVGAIDTNDYYRFSLTTLSSGSISINNTTANTGIQFLNSSGGVIDSFTTNGTEGNALFGEFNAGTYYVRIYPIGGANTNYNLNLVAFPGGFGEG